MSAMPNTVRYSPDLHERRLTHLLKLELSSHSAGASGLGLKSVFSPEGVCAPPTPPSPPPMSPVSTQLLTHVAIYRYVIKNKNIPLCLQNKNLQAN